MSNFTEIVPNLFMGGEIIPTVPDFGAVVNCRMLEDFAVIGNKPVLWVPFIDYAILPPLYFLTMAADFISTARAAFLKVCVHCGEGHNRSGLVVAYYLIKRCSPLNTAKEAIALIRSKRHGALSNQTFVDYLLSL